MCFHKAVKVGPLLWAPVARAPPCSSLGHSQLPWLQRLAAHRGRDLQGPLWGYPESCPHTLPSPVGPVAGSYSALDQGGGPLPQCPVPGLAGPTLSSTSGGLGPSPVADAVWSWPSPLPSLDLSFLLLKMEFGSLPCLLERLWGEQARAAVGCQPPQTIEFFGGGEEGGVGSADSDPEPSHGV